MPCQSIFVETFSSCINKFTPDHIYFYESGKINEIPLYIFFLLLFPYISDKSKEGWLESAEVWQP